MQLKFLFVLFIYAAQIFISYGITDTSYPCL